MDFHLLCSQLSPASFQPLTPNTTLTPSLRHTHRHTNPPLCSLMCQTFPCTLVEFFILSLFTLCRLSSMCVKAMRRQGWCLWGRCMRSHRWRLRTSASKWGTPPSRRLLKASSARPARWASRLSTSKSRFRALLISTNETIREEVEGNLTCVQMSNAHYSPTDFVINVKHTNGKRTFLVQLTSKVRSWWPQLELIRTTNDSLGSQSESFYWDVLWALSILVIVHLKTQTRDTQQIQQSPTCCFMYFNLRKVQIFSSFHFLNVEV